MAGDEEGMACEGELKLHIILTELNVFGNGNNETETVGYVCR